MFLTALRLLAALMGLPFEDPAFVTRPLTQTLLFSLAGLLAPLPLLALHRARRLVGVAYPLLLRVLRLARLPPLASPAVVSLALFLPHGVPLVPLRVPNAAEQWFALP